MVPVRGRPICSGWLIVVIPPGPGVEPYSIANCQGPNQLVSSNTRFFDDMLCAFSFRRVECRCWALYIPGGPPDRIASVCCRSVPA